MNLFSRGPMPRVLFWLQLLVVSIQLVLLIITLPAFAQEESARPLNSDSIALDQGYKIEPLISNLSVPTTAMFDGNDLLIAESGWANTAPARILRVKPDWQFEVIAQNGLEPPVTGLLMVSGRIIPRWRTLLCDSPRTQAPMA